MQADMQLNPAKNLMHVVSVGVCRYTTCVPKYTTVPLGIQDVFAGKLNVAVSVGTAAVFEDITV